MGKQADQAPERAVSPFWTFSLRIYGQPGVPPACLTLQDEHGVDVNVLLFALYAASCGRQLATGDVARITDNIEPWRATTVVPLRQVRRWLRETPEGFEADGVAALRQRVKAIELEAERLQQEALFAGWPMASLGAPAPADAAARANAKAYADALGVDFNEQAIGVLCAAFDRLGDNAK